MMKRQLFLLAILLVMIFSCNKVENPFRTENLIPWSIVAFDKLERTPSERVAMIKKLGFRQYAFGGRKKHIETMVTELNIARDEGIKISAVWLYINNKDTLRNLKRANEMVFESLKATGVSTQIWIGIAADFFEGLSKRQSLKKALNMISFLSKKAQKVNCKIALYNHGGWFGESENQLEIIKRLPQYDIGIIYNFHHAHKQLENYRSIIKKIYPFLWCVTLNGMKKGGPKIIPIGEGSLEKEMLHFLVKLGYKGPFGVLGHVKEEDVAFTLKKNLKGIQSLFVVK
jgi:sugar phosphate isomerase/epimerase